MAGAPTIVSVCGSLGAGSANRDALDVAAGRLRTTGVVHDVPHVAIAAVPMFDPAAVDDPPPAVAELRAVLEAADGVLIAAPEYAGGLAGGIKNALDWLVGSGSLYHRPVAVLSAGTTGGGFAIEQLVRTLSWQGALTVATLGIAAPATKMDGGRFTDPSTLAGIEAWADRLATAISLPAPALLARVREVVSPFGIDAVRFGLADQ
ncbi:MAG: NAD(P)H-dependent oxidoreductase [Acidimicrobiaceae bacterium]|nr:NAD(P)H-dependent oxidoreductase [Acidimicrobiaceae bacterium]MCO5328570.1 NAD(P)H-dependent oxidoreductase [Ilumatobacteraceae bacterium]